MSLRERKKTKTRDMLIKAAMELFKRRGFERTTVDDIAAAAEVSRRTFFRYFATKEMVAFPHQDQQLAGFRSLLSENRDVDNSFTAVRRALLELGRIYTEGKDEHLSQWRIIQASPTLVARGDQFDIDWEITIAGEAWIMRHWERCSSLPSV